MKAVLNRDSAATAVAWFSVLMHARIKGERSEATKAREELQRLGVTVRFCRTPKGGAE